MSQLRTTPQPVFAPKLWSALRAYSWEAFRGDAVSGVIVGIVALPLAIAFAIASGVTPDRGLTTAIIAGFLIAALGGSRVQIGGPTGAFVVIVYGIVTRYGLDGLLIATVLAGFILIAMGMLRLGTMIRFIPYPLTVGFTAGIAVVIFSSQIKDFFGLRVGPLPADIVGQWRVYAAALPSMDPPTLLLSLCSLFIVIAWPRVNRRLPGSIIAVLVITAAVHLGHLPVETIGSRFGRLPSGIPLPAWPHLPLADLPHLLKPALTIALLGAIESLLSATVADGMIEGRHRSNTELIAQGVANVVTPIFGGIPATGAIARTATNVKNGGRTPVAGLVHAATLFAIVLLFGSWARLIPLCTLAAILVVVAGHMGEWHAFKALLRAPRMDIAVLLTVFVLTVMTDLTVAVEVGLVLSAALFMKRMTDATVVRQWVQDVREQPTEETMRSARDATSRRRIPPGVAVYEAEGALFFGVAEVLRDMLDIGTNPPKAIIFRMRHVLALDASGIRALRDLRRRCGQMGTHLIVQGLHAQPLVAMDREGLLSEFGLDHVAASLDEAIALAQQVTAAHARLAAQEQARGDLRTALPQQA